MPPRRRATKASPFAQARPYDAAQVQQRRQKQFEDRVFSDLVHSKLLGRSKALQYTSGLLIPDDLREIAFRAETDSLTFAPRRQWLYGLGKKMQLNQTATEKNEAFYHTMAWNAVLEQPQHKSAAGQKPYTLFDFTAANKTPATATNALTTLPTSQQSSPSFTAKVLTVQEERRRRIDREIRLAEQERLANQIQRNGVDALRGAELDGLRRYVRRLQDQVNQTVDESERRQAQLQAEIEDMRQQGIERKQCEETLAQVRRDLEQKRNLANNLTVEHIHLAKTLEDVLTDSERFLRQIDENYQNQFRDRINAAIAQFRDPTGQGRNLEIGGPVWEALYNVAQYRPFTTQHQQAYQALHQAILDDVRRQVGAHPGRSQELRNAQLEQIQRLEAELDFLRRQRDDDVADMQQKLDRITDEAKRKDDDIQRHRADEQALQARLQRLQQNYDALQQEQKDITNQRGMIRALEQKNEQQERELQECEELMDGLLRELPQPIQDRLQAQKRPRPSGGTPVLSPRDLLKDIQTFIRDNRTNDDELRRLSQQLATMRKDFDRRRASQRQEWEDRQAALQARHRTELAAIQTQLNAKVQELKEEEQRNERYKTQAKTELDQLQNQLKNLQAANQKLIDQQTGDEKTNDSLMQTNDQLEKSLEQERARIKTLEGEIAQARAEAGRQKRDYDNMRDEAGKKEAQLDALRGSLRDCQQDADQLRLELNRLRADVPGEREKRKSVDQELEQKEQQLQRLQSDYDRVSKELQDTQRRLQSAEQNLTDCQARVIKFDAEAREANRRFVEVSEALRQAIVKQRQTSTENDKLRQELKEQAAKIAEYVSEKKQQEDAKEALDGRLQNLEQELADSVANVATLTRRLERQKQQLLSLQKTLAERDQTIQRMKDVAPREEKIDISSLNASQVLEHARRLLGVNAALLDRILQDQVESEARINAQLMQEMEQGRLRGQQITEQKEELQRRQREIDRLQQEKTDVVDELNKAIQAADVCQKALEECQRERARLETDVATRDETIRDLRQQITQLQQQIQDQGDSRQLQYRYEQLVKELRSRKLDMDEARRKEASLQQDLKQAEDEAQDLNERLRATDARAQAELRRCLQDYEQRNQALQRQLDEEVQHGTFNQQTIMTLKQEHGEMQRMMEEAKENAKASRRKMTEAVEHAGGRIQDLTRQLREEQQRNQEERLRMEGLARRMAEQIREARNNEDHYRNRLGAAYDEFANRIQRFERNLQHERDEYQRRIRHIQQEVIGLLGDPDVRGDLGSLGQVAMDNLRLVIEGPVVGGGERLRGGRVWSGNRRRFGEAEFQTQLAYEQRQVRQRLLRDIREQLPDAGRVPDTDRLRRAVDDFEDADLMRDLADLVGDEEKAEAPTVSSNRQLAPLFGQEVQQSNRMIQATPWDPNLMQKLRAARPTSGVPQVNMQEFPNYRLNTNYQPLKTYAQQQKQRRLMNPRARTQAGNAARARVAQLFR